VDSITKQADCEAAGRVWRQKASGGGFECAPAPKKMAKLPTNYYSLCWSHDTDAAVVEQSDKHTFTIKIADVEVLDIRSPQGMP